MSVPSSYLEMCRFVGPRLDAWTYAVSIHGACCLLGGLPCALLLHRWRSGGKQPSPHSCRALGVTVAAAVLLLRPLILNLAPTSCVESAWLGPFIASTCGFSTCMKAFNAASGYYQKGASRDPQNWVLWCLMLPEPVFSEVADVEDIDSDNITGDNSGKSGRPRRATSSELRQRLVACAGKILVLFGIISVLLPAGGPRYDLVSSDADASFFQRHLVDHTNGFVHVWLLYGFAAFCLDFSTLIDWGLTGGMAMGDGFRNPLLQSRALREVWGTRWNQTVHLLLKRTVYKPARSAGYGPIAAAVLTFVGSGLLHEYTFGVHNHAAIVDGVYTPGSVTLFFLGMGVLMVGESWVWHRVFPERLRQVIRKLPSPIAATLLLLLVSGPAERYFMRSWTASGFVEAAATMFPHLDCR